MEAINVLSLFDGISTGRLCLEEAGIPVRNYFASEIDKNPIKISKANWGDITYLGDVNKIDIEALPKIDLIIGGSPCQGFSRAGLGLNFEDPLSKLFFKYVEILDLLKKKNPEIKFMLENVLMAHEWRDVISEYLGVEPILIDSKRLGAAMRERNYWTNIEGIEQPEDQGIKLVDILDENVEIEGLIEKDGVLFDPTFSENSRNLVYVEDGEVRIRQATKQGYIVAEDGDGVNISFPLSKSRRGRVLKQKASTLDCACNFGCYKDGIIRRYTMPELEKLQGLPVGYTEFSKEDDETMAETSEGVRKKAIGNGWHAGTITHIFQYYKKEMEKRNHEKKDCSSRNHTEEKAAEKDNGSKNRPYRI